MGRHCSARPMSVVHHLSAEGCHDPRAGPYGRLSMPVTYSLLNRLVLSISSAYLAMAEA